MNIEKFIKQKNLKLKPISRYFLKNLKEGDIIHMVQVVPFKNNKIFEDYGKEICLRKYILNNSKFFDVFSLKDGSITKEISENDTICEPPKLYVRKVN